MLKKNFWKKKINQFNKEEWEALCDRCGKCCLIKLEDEDNGEIFYTNISCKLLCVKTGNCTNYINRKKIVKDCTTLSYNNIDTLKWMPKTCSYRLINEGKKLPSWHYLLTGNFKEMEKQKMCVRNRVTSEKEIDIKKIQNYITDWENN